MIVEHLPLLSTKHLVEVGTDRVELQGFGTRETPTTFFHGGRLPGDTGSIEVLEGIKSVESEGKEAL